MAASAANSGAAATVVGGLRLASGASRVLQVDTINAELREMQYAVRGAVPTRAGEIEEEMAAGVEFPFDHITYCNIGNPHSLQQKPITFFRQVLAMLEYPALLDSDHVNDVFPSDAIARARTLLEHNPSGVGAYTHSKGVAYIRQRIAEHIEARDGHPSHFKNIFITDGASPAVKTVLNAAIRDKSDGVMIPMPQYPLYSASITAFGGTAVPYYLREDEGWALKVEDLAESLAKARNDGIDVRALVTINPGNPTGAVMSEENIHDVVRFCASEGLLICADEVYQTNIYEPEERPFVSHKKAVMDLGADVELISFHSISKGMVGECGHRGGYMECHNMDPAVLEEFNKLVSVCLCSNTIGQHLIELMLHPPVPGDPSYELYNAEVTGIYDSLKERASFLADTLNGLDGIDCAQASGAMYLFPKVHMPPKFVAEAAAQGVEADAIYTMELLEKTGLCAVPGSGFGVPDHFRLTFLPQMDEIKAVCARLSTFQDEFNARWAQKRWVQLERTGLVGWKLPAWQPSTT